MYLAIVADELGNRYALQQRFVRLQVKQATALPTSGWDFSQMMAVDYQFDHLGTNVSRVHSLAQRASLDLAGADVSQNLVWVSAYAAQAKDTHDSTTSIIAAGDNSDKNIECRQSVALRAPQLALTFFKTHCAQLEQSTEFVYSRSIAMPVDGEYEFDGKRLKVKGHGWMMHGWGVPPDAKSRAVVFDRAWLLFDNEIDVQLQRTQRRSGRGPKITTGTLTRINTSNHADAFTVSLPLSDAQLIDEAMGDNGLIPTSIQLTVPTNPIDVKLKPLLSTETNQRGESNTWFGAVSVEGSHTGYGFINLNAL